MPCNMAETCGGSACHSGDEPAADLEIVASGLAASLVDVPSTSCEGRLLVDSQNPEDSFFLEKVVSSEPECGAPMPFVGEGLSAEEVACVEDLVYDLAETTSADAGVPPADAESLR